MKKLVYSLALLFITTIDTSYATNCDKFKENQPVLAGGRVKPLLVLAKETTKFLTGKTNVKNKGPLEIYCEMVLSAVTEKSFELPILVEHVNTKKVLGLSQEQKTITSTELIEKKDQLRSEILQIKENTSEKKDLIKTFNRLQTYEGVVTGKSFTVFTSINGTKKWRSIVNHFNDGTAGIINAIKESKSEYDKDKNTDYLLELTYVKSHIFSYAMLLSLVAIFLTVIMKNMKAGVSVALIAIIVEIIGMTMRVLISGRAPITNMYETVMFSGFGALTISMVILFFKRDKVYLIAGLAYNILCLMMMMFANNMLSSSIAPLVPVLRDNFWLSTHVTTIILSYAALALSWIMANITLLKLRFGNISKKEYRYYEQLTYTCIKVGIVLLSAGIILGGVWADYSWGRFWGWDPKETWSLIVLLFYMVMVHGKYTSWINTNRFIILSSLGFMLVMMAWFGVNYILASGLHSYGFSEGGAIFLGAFFISQIVFTVVCTFKTQLTEKKND